MTAHPISFDVGLRKGRQAAATQARLRFAIAQPQKQKALGCESLERLGRGSGA